MFFHFFVCLFILKILFFQLKTDLCASQVLTKPAMAMGHFDQGVASPSVVLARWQSKEERERESYILSFSNTVAIVINT